MSLLLTQNTGSNLTINNNQSLSFTLIENVQTNSDGGGSVLLVIDGAYSTPQPALDLNTIDSATGTISLNISNSGAFEPFDQNDIGFWGTLGVNLQDDFGFSTVNPDDFVMAFVFDTLSLGQETLGSTGDQFIFSTGIVDINNSSPAFNNGTFNSYLINGETGDIISNTQMINVTGVPEPSSALLITLGSVVALLNRKRR